MVTGTGLGAAREKKTPVKSMRVAGPLERIDKQCGDNMHVRTLVVVGNIGKSITHCFDHGEVISQQHKICSLADTDFAPIFKF